MNNSSKKTLDREIQEVLELENELGKRKGILQKIKRYEQLERKGLIETDSYSVRRVDTIGYSKYGFSL